MLRLRTLFLCPSNTIQKSDKKIPRWCGGGWAGLCVSVFSCSGRPRQFNKSADVHLAVWLCNCVTVDADAPPRSAESRLQCLDCAVCCSSLARSLSCTPAHSIPGTSRVTLELSTTFRDFSLLKIPNSTFKNLLRHYAKGKLSRISTVDMLASRISWQCAPINTAPPPWHWHCGSCDL